MKGKCNQSSGRCTRRAALALLALVLPLAGNSAASAASPALVVHYATGTYSVAPRASHTVVEACPSGYIPIGGGYAVSSESLQVNGSTVYNNKSGARATASSNSWGVSITNTSNAAHSLVVEVTCLTGSANVVVHMDSRSVAVKPGTFADVGIACDKGQQPIAGGYYFAPNSELRVNDTGVYRNTATKAEAWLSTGTNGSRSTQTLDVFTGCVDSVSVHYAQGESSTVSKGLVTAYAQCPSGWSAVAGGYSSVQPMELGASTWFAPHLPSVNEWEILAKPTTTNTQLTADAVCLAGATLK